MENMVRMGNLFNGVFKGRKVLITGDTGFKGSWLSIWLNEMGAHVFGYALPPLAPHDNFVVTHLKDRIVHLDGDIINYEKFLSFVEEIKPEIVFHLAAQPLVLKSYKNPRETFETNLLGTVNFFEAVRKVTSIRAAVNVTSDKCYENQNWVWGYRENEPMGGKDPYSSSKGCSELITSAYTHSFFQSDDTAAVASARAGNVVGGGDWAEDRIVPDFFRACINGSSLTMRNPSNTRPWQHVLEPLSGYLLLASKLFLNGKKFSGGWNFGPSDSNHYTVKELVTRMIHVFGSGSFTTPDSFEKPYEAHLLKLDITKAIKYLDWKPVLDFQQTVEFTVNGYRGELNERDVYQHRVKQIGQYIEIANKLDIKWAK